MPRLNTTDSHPAVGDMVMLAGLAEAARESNDPIAFYAPRDGHYRLLRLMGQDVNDDPRHTGMSLSPAYEAETRDAGRKPRIDYLREFLRLESGFSRPTFSFSPADLEWARQTQQDHGEDLVLLFPQATRKCQEWPACYWVELAWQLKARNVSVLVVLNNQEEQLMNVPRVIWGFDLGKVAALIGLSALVVAGDVDGAHLAGAMNVPAIALCGPTRPECAFHHLPAIIALSSSGPPHCAGCHFQSPYRPACDLGCQVLYAVQPHVVLGRTVSELAVITKRLQVTSAQPASPGSPDLKPSI